MSTRDTLDKLHQLHAKEVPHEAKIAASNIPPTDGEQQFAIARAMFERLNKGRPFDQEPATLQAEWVLAVSNSLDLMQPFETGVARRCLRMLKAREEFLKLLKGLPPATPQAVERQDRAQFAMDEALDNLTTFVETFLERRVHARLGQLQDRLAHSQHGDSSRPK